MAEETPSREPAESEEKEVPAAGKRDTVRLVTWIGLLTAAVEFTWYLGPS